MAHGQADRSAVGVNRPAISVAVVLERQADPNPWEAWRFRLLEVIPHEEAFGREPRIIHQEGKTSRWLFPGFEVALYTDECKGYFLNLTSGNPSWFVSWRHPDDDPSQVEVTAASVSYIEADRRLFAGESVESVPLDPALCDWLQSYTNEHFQPDEKRAVRAMSFMSPAERERMAATLRRSADPQSSD